MPEQQTTITIKCAADITELGDKLRFYNLNSLKENSIPFRVVNVRE
jgi:hypothetical protein